MPEDVGVASGRRGRTGCGGYAVLADWPRLERRRLAAITWCRKSVQKTLTRGARAPYGHFEWHGERVRDVPTGDLTGYRLQRWCARGRQERG